MSNSLLVSLLLATSLSAQMIGVRVDAPTQVPNNGSSVVRITPFRDVHFVLFDSSGNAFGTAGNALSVTCISGCAAGATFADNSAFTAGTTGVTNIGAVFNDGLAAVTSGNAANPRITASRAIHFNLRDNSGNELGISSAPLQVSLANTAANATAVTISGNANATLSAETTKVIGTVRNVGNIGAVFDGAPGATDTANAISTGLKGVSAEQTAVTTGQLVKAVADLVGKQIVLPYANPENFVMGTTAAIVDTTSTSVIASAGGSLRNYITQCTVTNSHATVGTFVKILDGTTIIWEAYAAAVGGGAAASFPVPLRGTAATAINCQPVTTGANVICSCSGYKGL